MTPSLSVESATDDGHIADTGGIYGQSQTLSCGPVVRTVIAAQERACARRFTNDRSRLGHRLRRLLRLSGFDELHAEVIFARCLGSACGEERQ